MTANQLEVIHNFKQEGDESLYQALERYNDMLYKCPTHDINSHQKVNIFYKGLSTMNRQLLDSQGPIPGMTPAQALTAIQTMADHSQKWHDGTSRNIENSSSKDGLAALVNKLDNLGRDIEKVKESVHAIQVRCQICEGPHLDKDCPLKEEVKQVEEVKYGEFGGTSPFNENNGVKFRIEKLQENAEINTRNQNASLKNLETQIEQLTKELCSRKEKSEQAKVVIIEHEGPSSPKKLKNLHGISFLSDSQEENTNDQLPTKESNPGHFTLPYTVGNFYFYAMANLGASVNVLPRNIFEYLELTNLSETEMLVEMADMRKKAPLWIVRDILVKIDKFLFPSDFVILDQTTNSTAILGRPFLATVHAQISVFEKEISVGIGDERINDDSTTTHFCKPIIQECDKDFKAWPSCNPFRNKCDGGHEIYRINELGKTKYWFFPNNNERKEMKGGGVSFLNFLMIRDGSCQVKDFVWSESFICDSGENNETLSLGRKNGSRFRKMIMEEMEEVLGNDGEDSDDKT
ncbi:reverse transcriptase domain-containing protein [Tanacetum coccineum]